MKKLLAGFAAWCVTEYAIHRWVMHGRGRTNFMAREHREHHRDPQGTTHVVRLERVTMLAGALSYGEWYLAGWLLGVNVYTLMHHSIHHSRPRYPIQRAIWNNHWEHHRRLNGHFGVTLPI